MKTCTQRVTEDIQRRQLVWCEHFIHMGDERLLGNVRKYFPDWKKRGRLQGTWIKRVLYAVSQRNLQIDC